MKKSYKIEVDCANCANKMEEAAKNTAGVKDATVNFMALKMIVEFEDGQEPKADTTLNNGLKDVPSRLLTPIDVNKNNIKDTVVKDGFHKESEL